MARHGGKGAVLRIFLLNAGIFTRFLFHQFSKMAEGGDFRSSHL